MTNESMVIQQAQRELGDQYEVALHEARNFVKWLLARHYRRQMKHIVMRGEGGPNRMVETCLAYIVNAGAVGDGIKEYFRTLSREYLGNKEEVPYEVLPDDTLQNPRLTGETEVTEGEAETSSPLEGGSPLTDRLLQTAEERELFETLAAIGGGADRRGGNRPGGSVRAAAEIMGIDADEADRTYRRVRRRAMRLPAVVTIMLYLM